MLGQAPPPDIDPHIWQLVQQLGQSADASTPTLPPSTMGPPPAQNTPPPPIAQQPYVQAEQLTAQAAPPPDPTSGMSPMKAALYKGIQGFGQGLAYSHTPGGYAGHVQQQYENERQRQQDLLTRAKELRGEGLAQSELYGQQQERDLTRERQTRVDALSQRNIESEIANRESEMKARLTTKPGVETSEEQAVKARMARTGETYDVAYQAIRAEGKSAPTIPEDEKINLLKVKKIQGTITKQEEQELAARLSTKTAVTNQSNVNITGRQDVAAGRKEVMTAFNDLKDAKLRLAAMKDAKMRAESSASPGASDMVLLSNHIGMTFGSVKGARTGRDLIEAHLAAKSLPESLAVTAQRILHGAQLSPQQRTEFLNAAENRTQELTNTYGQVKEVWNYTPPGEKDLDVPAGKIPGVPEVPPQTFALKAGEVMVEKDGKLFALPESQLKKAIDQGYKKVQK